MKLLCLDCDSTLSSIEGIDELARLRGPGRFQQVEEMTSQAMDGAIPIEEVFGRRLDIIQPTEADVAAIGRKYVETVEPTAKATIAALGAKGWTPVILSGGFRQAIRPLADFLGIARVEAVDLRFNPDGSYAGFDSYYPTTRSGGKPEVIIALKKEFSPEKTVMVGDGSSDLEAMPYVDSFVGFGRYADRYAVRVSAGSFIRSLDALVDLI